MSTIVIVSICAAIAAVIGLRVYIEHKQEKELEKAGNEGVFSDLQAFVINPHEPIVAPIVVEEKPENQPIVEIENINSAAAQAEAKPKKKKRYYGKRKPQIKNKQTKK